MQKYVPNALVMFAPYVNSYRRLTRAASAPVNIKWGYDNRTTGLSRPALRAGGAAASRTASRPPTPIPIWRWPPRSPAASSA